MEKVSVDAMLLYCSSSNIVVDILWIFILFQREKDLIIQARSEGQTQPQSRLR